MIKFDDLPHTQRTLILASLQLEIAEANCANILDLARKRNQDIHEIWRDVCRDAGQPRCTMPAPVMAPRDQWQSMTAAPLDPPMARAAGSATAALSESPTVTSLEAPTAPYSDSPMPTSLKPLAATPSPKAGSVNTGATAAPVKMARAAPASGPGGHRASNRRGLLVAGLAIILAVGGGLFVMVASRNWSVAPQASLQLPNAKPGDVIRDGIIIRDRRNAGADKPDKAPEFDPATLPPPAGTMRRLDAISKSFGKR